MVVKSLKSKKKIKNRKLQVSKKKGVKIINIFEKKMSDEKIKKKEGDYFDESHYDIIVNYDADVYYIDESGNKKLLGKFRKKVLPTNLCNIGMDNLKEAAKKYHDNRGAAAGKIDISKLPSYANDPSKWNSKSNFRISGYYSKITNNLVNNCIGNLSQSNIIGYFDRRDRNLGKDAPKCRTTAFTSQQVDKWLKVLPLIKQIDRQFKLLIPDRYNLQYNRAKQTPWRIKNTCFSTLTINYNWRTALHKDSGDYDKGYGNLVVLEEGKYKGGYTGFPQFGVAFDVRNGDFLAMDVHEWHCNTKIKPITKDYSRVSLVAYLRKNMINCKGMKMY